MIQVTNSQLRHLAYLFLSFAHLSDFELLPEEIAEAKVRLQNYTDPSADTNIDNLMEEVIHWYNSSADTRLQVVNSIAVTFNFDLPEKEMKLSILEDLVSIGKADNNYIESEKEFIRMLSKAWNISFTP